MEERLRFIARLLEGERMSDVCRAFDSNRQDGVIQVFVRLFKDYGLPDAIRSDNSLPRA